jgi:hypothetical protein
MTVHECQINYRKTLLNFLKPETVNMLATFLKCFLTVLAHFKNFFIVSPPAQSVIIPVVFVPGSCLAFPYTGLALFHCSVCSCIVCFFKRFAPAQCFLTVFIPAQCF